MMPLNPSSLAFIAIGSTPLMGRIEPSSASSPIIIYWFNSSPGTCSDAASMPIANVKSYEEPSFLISAGAMLIVICLPGILYPLFRKAASMRW